jgi:mRNA interferase RelE/StbE
MRVEFLSKFSRDIDRIRIQSVKKAVSDVIQRVERAGHFREVPNTKKLLGHKSAYRIRIGDYRIGVFVDHDLVQFARVVHRKDIYGVFP